ncbi:baculoviral IAP repeat-containing protein 5 [Eurytemora carolleeae]|uniref:baculoviral IAP repeat-containing protein 5 n=1 Tax=Eurytemora carolleeae TaxID=1294199 RepID=UPI000C7888C8|nr:baculoviral IAP repeat-containing protein 5 [Eurytemora carolleeae]|eukprot:XP_023320669.1 baculoviral IAP repeat-containing protein 5-like [Eurytemora affinis]
MPPKANVNANRCDMRGSALLKTFGADDVIMLSFTDRVNSFKGWPFSDEDECTPPKMAAAGFYACGGIKEPDLARCVVCRKELDGWEPFDDPWSAFFI